MLKNPTLKTLTICCLLLISTHSRLLAQPRLLSRVILQEPDSVAIKAPTSLSISGSGSKLVLFDGVVDASAYFFRTATGECTGTLIADKTPYLLDSAAYHCRTSPCSPWLKPEALVKYDVINPRHFREETGEELGMFASDLQSSFLCGSFVGERLFLKSYLMKVIRTIGRGLTRFRDPSKPVTLDTNLSLSELISIIEYDCNDNTIASIQPIFSRADYSLQEPDSYVGVGSEFRPYMMVDTSRREVFLQSFNGLAVKNKRFSECVLVSAYSLNDCARRDICMAPLRDSTGARTYPDEQGSTPTLFARNPSGKFFYLFDRGRGIYDQQGEKTPVGISWKAVSAALANMPANDKGKRDSLTSKYTYSLRHEDLRADTSGFTVLSLVDVNLPTSKDMLTKGTLWCLQRYAADGTVLSVITQPEFRSDRSAYTCRLSADATTLYCVYLNKATELWELDTYDVRR
ncbi:MAG: hypothetical protein ACKOBV_08335 [Candidatus Kapaibacterium sp.]